MQQSNRTYLTYLDDDTGLFEHTSQVKLFIVPLNSELKVRVRFGSKYSQGSADGPTLVVNFPASSSNYTATQPLKWTGEEETREVRNNSGGWALDTQYLEQIQPEEEEELVTYYEFLIKLEYAGSFFIQTVCGKTISPPNYINVEPILTLSQQQAPLRCKQLSMISVLSRCLGPITRWPNVLEPLANQGYNIIHFTPIQVYGESKSHYSLADQTRLDDCYFSNKSLSNDLQLEQLQKTTTALRKSHGLLSLVDIVLNHTANNSAWIQDHPEACYSTDMVPRLWPAWLLDNLLREVSDEFSRGNIHWCPAAPYLRNESDLTQVINEMTWRAKKLDLWQYFQCDTKIDKRLLEASLKDKTQIEERIIQKWKIEHSQNKLEWFQNNMMVGFGHGPQGKQVKLKLNECAQFFAKLHGQNLESAAREIQDLIRQSNDFWVKKIDSFIHEGMENSRGAIRYFKITLKKPLITLEHRILDPYFSVLQDGSKVVHNGWILDQRPDVDFAEEVNWNYLRRTINIWGDSIKLRYGKKPSDSPYLWARMVEYCQKMASAFDGFRLDNAHSTPLHLCQYVLQAARCVNPNLFIMAELFTPSAEYDALFTRDLNINGLIREMQNRQDARGVSQYYHQLTCQEAPIGKLQPESDIPEILVPSRPSEVIYDMTHDNPSFLDRFGNRMLHLPMAGLLSCCDQICATTWGYDQMVPKNYCVVKESRQYPIQDKLQDDSIKENSQNQEQDFEVWLQWRDCSRVRIAGEFNGWRPEMELVRTGSDHWKGSIKLKVARRCEFKFVVDNDKWVINHELPKCNDGHGNVNNYLEFGKIRSQPTQFGDIRMLRQKLNNARQMSNQEKAEIYLHTQSDEILVVTRQFELTKDNFDAYVTICRFCYPGCDWNAKVEQTIDLPGQLVEVVFAAYTEDAMQKQGPDYNEKQQKEQFINNPPAKVLVHSDLDAFCSVSPDGKKLHFHWMPPGFTCLVKTQSPEAARTAVKTLNAAIDSMSESLFKNCELQDINHILFRCEDEEKDISQGARGTYGLPSHKFEYAGITSAVAIIKQQLIDGDMGCELFQNIREGPWLFDYFTNRLESHNQAHTALKHFFQDCGPQLINLPTAIRPRYVSSLLLKLHSLATSYLTNTLMNDSSICDSPDPFVHQLSLAAAQMHASVPSSAFSNFKASICAGLPHFSTGYMRCWGRDTFIALPGCYLSTGLYKQAKDTIMYFAKVCRHGLIPNLHDQGNNTRFNARDATWFFLQAIKEYINYTDEIDILKEQIDLIFTQPGSSNEANRSVTLEQLICHILQEHAKGIKFREWNAGTKIDDQMRDNGFNVDVKLDEKTGFIYGGNADNCGTWMDKMGSAYNVNKGVPATPRDGAPIELVGLQYSVLTFLDQLATEGKFATDKVKLDNGQRFLTFKEWAAKMKANFEHLFYIPTSPSEDQSYQVAKNLVNRRGIYKDTHLSSHKYTDYQLRPNVCVALAVAPDLFDPDHAKICLEKIDMILMEPNCMGIKTLDPSDRNYNGDYVNSDHTHGWNYHQGPEWLWPVGYFLQAKLNFASPKDSDQLSKEAKAALQATIFEPMLCHQKHLKTDPWQSLPELTNSHGKKCHDSCPAQAWSVATLLDTIVSYYELD